MNEQLQNALADILIKAAQTAERAGEFVLTELPADAHALALWAVWDTGMGAEPDVSCALRDFNANAEALIENEIERRAR